MNNISRVYVFQSSKSLVQEVLPRINEQKEISVMYWTTELHCEVQQELKTEIYYLAMLLWQTLVGTNNMVKISVHELRGNVDISKFSA
jgi:hypothetical protein